MNETEKILHALDDKEPEKKPSNWELWSALYFAEFIFVLLDAGSALSVWWITSYWYYGLIVFFAGVVPLWLYTKQYTRAQASIPQRKTAFAGGVIAVASVLVVAIFMAILNFVAKIYAGDAVMWTEAGLAVSLVLLLATHGFVMGRYFFIDEEITETQKTNRMIARGDQGIRRIGIANKVASAKKKEVALRDDFERKFSPEVLNKIMSLMQDLDGDGIPDFIDPTDDRTGKPFQKQGNQQMRPSYGSDTQQVKLSDNHKGEQDFTDRQSQNK